MAEKAGGLVRVYYKGNVEDKDTGTPAHPGGPEDMFPIDANHAVSRFPDQWSFKPWGNNRDQRADPDPESLASAHGDQSVNDEMTALRRDGLAAEPAGALEGRRDALVPAKAIQEGPVTIVDPALDKTEGPGNGPKAGDTDIAANRRGKKAD